MTQNDLTSSPSLTPLGCDALLACFFKFMPAAQKLWLKKGLFNALESSRKTNLVDLKKGRQNFENF